MADAARSKKILLTSARSFLTLDLARQFREAGHDLYVVDTSCWTVTHFSNAIKQSFVVPSPRFETEAFIQAIVNIIREEGIEFVIPIYEEILYLSKYKHLFPSSCEVFCPSFEQLHVLHNKWLFYELLRSQGIDTPRTYLIECRDDLKKLEGSGPYALKASYSRASLNVKKIYPCGSVPDIAIEPHNPWIAQEWLEGNKYCSYVLCHEGKVKAHSLYPVEYAIDGNSCVTFKAVHHPGILKWTQKLAASLKFTGQMAFDFIETADGRIFAIECNPRATSGLQLFTAEDGLDRAFFNANEHLLTPKPGASKQIATGMILYGWRKSAHPSNTWGRYISTLLSLQDVIFSLRDLKPFLLQPFVFAHLWVNGRRKGLSIPAIFMHDFEWNGDGERAVSTVRAAERTVERSPSIGDRGIVNS